MSFRRGGSQSPGGRLPNHVDPRVPATAGLNRTERSGTDEGVGVGEIAGGMVGSSIAQPGCTSALTAKGSVQAGGGAGTNRAGKGTVGDYLLQAVQDPDSGGRAGE
jgi:hypothetical protein